MRNATRSATLELVDPQTGRLDAQRVAEYLHLRVSDLAEITGDAGELVHQNPDAPAVQSQLEKVAVIVNGLLTLTAGDKEQALLWLNAPHPALDRESPLDLMRGAELDVVVDLVIDMLSGAPA